MRDLGARWTKKKKVSSRKGTLLRRRIILNLMEIMHSKKNPVSTGFFNFYFSKKLSFLINGLYPIAFRLSSATFASLYELNSPT